MRRRAFLAGSASLVLGGCDAPPEIEWSDKIHELGRIRVPVPAGFEASIDHFAVLLKRAGTARDERTTRIYLDPFFAPPASAKRRSVASTEAFYTMTPLAGRGSGSGGTLYNLIAWRREHDAWLVMYALEQSEFWEPSFAIPWAVFDGTEVLP